MIKRFGQRIFCLLAAGAVGIFTNFSSTFAMDFSIKQTFIATSKQEFQSVNMDGTFELTAYHSKTTGEIVSTSIMGKHSQPIDSIEERIPGVDYEGHSFLYLNRNLNNQPQLEEPKLWTVELNYRAKLPFRDQKDIFIESEFKFEGQAQVVRGTWDSYLQGEEVVLILTPESQAAYNAKMQVVYKAVYEQVGPMTSKTILAQVGAHFKTDVVLDEVKSTGSYTIQGTKHKLYVTSPRASGSATFNSTILGNFF